jgi:type II secretory ATPase GspE/PulE/Tfp pilus assembly ATPase PilB-like protein/FixJ family two-component response regulator
MSKYSELFKVSAKGSGADLVLDAVEHDNYEKEKGFTILFVDDEEGVLNSLRRIFLEENYRIFTSTSAERALEIMSCENVHLVVSDHRMPGMTGAELLKEIRQKWPETIRIMLTGYADVSSVMGAVKEGAVYKFITKPWNDEDLRLTVSLALQQYVLLRENQKLKEIARRQQLKIKNYAGLIDESRGKIGFILLKTGEIGREDLDRAQKARLSDEVLGETLVRLGLTSEVKIVNALRNYLSVESIDLKEALIPAATVRFLPRELCEKHRMLPVKLDGRQLSLALADPSDICKLDNISLMTGLKVVPLIAPSSDILDKLKSVYGAEHDNAFDTLDDLSDLEPVDEIDIILEEDEREINLQELIGSSEVPPIVRIVNSIISESIRYRASDIHIEPKTKYSVIRFRIDGLLQSKIKVPADLHPAVISRIKILAKMDISERRKPQDGRITVKTGTRIVDIRVSSMPTISGEKMVMRILDKSASIKKIEELGVLPGDLKKINTMIKKPQGVIISTGPTGSGKTTMLYSILSAMMEGSKNYETIEEPVEYFLEDASQVAVREKIGLSFAQILRATLRQDPDVILVGEVRDQETADVAFKASLTGHMVLTSLHTNSSVASITRLLDMGIKPYILASALEGIIAQRLVRKVCEHCKTAVVPDRDILELLKISPEIIGGEVYRGKGCQRCNNSGYFGRIGVFEFFVMCDDYRHLISGAYREAELLEMSRDNGMATLMEDGIAKVKMGYTTLEELLRVIGPQTLFERRCAKCERMIDAKFLFCPYCGTFRRNYCHACKLPLEEDWVSCPFCGTPRPDLPNVCGVVEICRK